ncbi:Atrial natriuretic peptide receptor 1 [Strongyloides ratti]|uniref:Guanylate cyclase n=1 Tax=Strongyloides ratti TaxID=34506 RepID=A0A090KZB8_STRRB|nr:Atrial natriuretic peptide receptor 1 [Strongyloides ratti]CEF62875.1 Atrial natriuretic peptide receptor 1 [Strongyloides ratti]
MLKIIILLLFTYTLSILTYEIPKKFSLGFLIPHTDDPILEANVDFYRVAGAIPIAINKSKEDKVIPQDTIVDVVWYYDNCDEALASGYTAKLMFDDKVDVIIGPACSDAAAQSGSLTTYYNFPQVIFGQVISSDLSQVDKYSTQILVSADTGNFASAVSALLLNFGWRQFAFFYSYTTANPLSGCAYIQSDMDLAVYALPELSMIYKRGISLYNDDELATAILRMNVTARIIVSCFDDIDTQIRFLNLVNQLIVNMNEYVFIFIQTWKKGFGNPLLWDVPENKTVANNVKQACKHVIIFDLQPYNDSLTSFLDDVKIAIQQEPFNCKNCTNLTMSEFAASLADGIQAYFRGIVKSIESGTPNATNDGNKFLQNAETTFQGFTGKVSLNQNGSRDPTFYVYTLGDNYNVNLIAMISITYNQTSYTSVISDDKKIFQNWGGVRPLAIPKCNFDGSDCQPSFFSQNLSWIIVLIVIGILIILSVIFTIIYVFYQRKLERERQNLLWQIKFIELTKPGEKDNLTKSTRSFQSGVSSTSTKITIDSKVDTDSHGFYIWNNENVVGRKSNIRIKLGDKECKEMRFLRSLDHDNLCKLLGMSIDSISFIVIWRYCSRGSLYDVIEQQNTQMDDFFCYCLIKDIVSALDFIHDNSMLAYHGHLTSKVCLIDERWQIKISGYGPKFLQLHETKSQHTNLWMAPEILRDPSLNGTPTADIYSFAIIMSEVINQKTAWNLDEIEENEDDIIYKVKRGGLNLFRPKLVPDDRLQVNSSILHLIRDCWSENPSERPKTSTIKSLLKSIHSSKGENLMDHMFGIMEQYASNLEQEVEERMKELIEEKKKADILLYRMLPKTVADKLKLGQTVQPESFESVTIFFSDVVSFTTLCSKSTPLQVVTLLNELYTTFDAIIDENGVFKVETIGDGYLCVSGLPVRNGNEHAKHIADMSFGFLRSLKTFRVPHIKDGRINIRIGIHTGPVVAGVVGLTMPRYCLFGDSVNIASRMESNSKPGRIQISIETNRYLTEIIGGYHTEPRGEVIVKGQGVMQTYWLLTGEETPEDLEEMKK